MPNTIEILSGDFNYEEPVEDVLGGEFDYGSIADPVPLSEGMYDTPRKLPIEVESWLDGPGFKLDEHSIRQRESGAFPSAAAAERRTVAADPELAGNVDFDTGAGFSARADAGFASGKSREKELELKFYNDNPKDENGEPLGVWKVVPVPGYGNSYGFKNDKSDPDEKWKIFDPRRLESGDFSEAIATAPEMIGAIAGQFWKGAKLVQTPIARAWRSAWGFALGRGTKEITEWQSGEQLDPVDEVLYEGLVDSLTEFAFAYGGEFAAGARSMTKAPGIFPTSDEFRKRIDEFWQNEAADLPIPANLATGNKWLHRIAMQGREAGGDYDARALAIQEKVLHHMRRMLGEGYDATTASDAVKRKIGIGVERDLRRIVNSVENPNILFHNASTKQRKEWMRWKDETGTTEDGIYKKQFEKVPRNVEVVFNNKEIKPYLHEIIEEFKEKGAPTRDPVTGQYVTGPTQDWSMRHPELRKLYDQILNTSNDVSYESIKRFRNYVGKLASSGDEIAGQVNISQGEAKQLYGMITKVMANPRGVGGRLPADFVHGWKKATRYSRMRYKALNKEFYQQWVRDDAPTGDILKSFVEGKTIQPDKLIWAKNTLGRTPHGREALSEMRGAFKSHYLRKPELINDMLNKFKDDPESLKFFLAPDEIKTFTKMGKDLDVLKQSQAWSVWQATEEAGSSAVKLVNHGDARDLAKRITQLGGDGSTGHRALQYAYMNTVIKNSLRTIDGKDVIDPHIFRAEMNKVQRAESLGAFKVLFPDEAVRKRLQDLEAVNAVVNYTGTDTGSSMAVAGDMSAMLSGVHGDFYRMARGASMLGVRKYFGRLMVDGSKRPLLMKEFREKTNPSVFLRALATTIGATRHDLLRLSNQGYESVLRGQTEHPNKDAPKAKNYLEDFIDYAMPPSEASVQGQNAVPGSIEHAQRKIAENESFLQDARKQSLPYADANYQQSPGRVSRGMIGVDQPNPELETIPNTFGQQTDIPPELQHLQPAQHEIAREQFNPEGLRPDEMNPNLGAGIEPAPQLGQSGPIGNPQYMKNLGGLFEGMSPEQQLELAKNQRFEQIKTQPPKMLISNVQQMLTDLGINNPSRGGTQIDGMRGPKTQRAIKRFQKSLGMKMTGKITEELLKALLGI